LLYVANTQTDRQTDRRTNSGKNTTYLAEVITKYATANRMCQAITNTSGKWNVSILFDTVWQKSAPSQSLSYA